MRKIHNRLLTDASELGDTLSFADAGANGSIVPAGVMDHSLRMMPMTAIAFDDQNL